MFMPNVLHFFRSSNALRRYYQTIQTTGMQDPLVRLLPMLDSLPLETTEGTAINAATLLKRGPYLTLRGTTGSGRSLALRQIVQQCATSNYIEPVLLVRLAQMDIPNLPPRNVLATRMHETGMNVTLDPLVGVPAGQPWILLIDEWEELPALRRDAWRSFLLALDKIWPEARVVVAVPNVGDDWPGYYPVTIARPDEAHIYRWLSHLLSHQTVEPLTEALAQGKPLERLGERLLEIVLLALTYPTDGLPASRLDLYERAAARVRAIADSSSPPSFVRRYELACTMAGAGNLSPLLTLQDAERAEVALLLAGLLSDPSQLYAKLWTGVQSTPTSILTLARCLREYPTRAPTWGLPILEALAAFRTQPAHRAMLQSLGPILPDLLSTPGVNIPAERLHVVFADIAPILTMRPFLSILDHTGIQPSLRWEAAEALLLLNPGKSLFAAASPPDRLSQAARGYILAMGTTEERHLLAHTQAAEWIIALRDESVVNQWRRTRAACALVNESTLPAVLRATALALLSQTQDKTTLALLKRACFDRDKAVRYAALIALRNQTPEHALSILGELLLVADAPWETKRDVLEELASYDHEDVRVLLNRGVLSASLPVVGRLRALQFLAKRQQTTPLLNRLLFTRTAHPAVRLMVARLLAHHADPHRAYPTLYQFARASDTLLLRQGAVSALGMLGNRVIISTPPDLPEKEEREIRQALLDLLSRIASETNDDIMLKMELVQALKMTGDLSSIPLLRAILLDDTANQVRAVWLQHIPHLTTLPVSQWAEIAMPASMRITLLTVLTEGENDAEQPSSLDELVEQLAVRLRTTTAEALVSIGTESNADEPTRQEIQQMLAQRLHGTPSFFEKRRLLVLLATLAGDDGLHLLKEMLGTSSADPTLRWLTIEQLGGNPSAIPLLLHYLEHDDLDPFTRGILVEKLGEHRSLHALPALQRIVRQPDANLHLRTRAIDALGKLETPDATETILELIARRNEPPSLRGAAATSLPAPLSPATRRWLYDFLRHAQPFPELIEGVLLALGNAGIPDEEAIPTLLHYAQGDHAGVAVAAITALARLGNPSIAPTLIRITQKTNGDQNVRLRAVITLLRLCGEKYLPFLRSFLDCDILPLQLQALEELLTHWRDYAQPMILVANKSAPLALRLRALEDVAQRKEHHRILSELLLDSSEPLPIRNSIASLMGNTSSPDAVEALARCGRTTGTAPSVRRRCIGALARQARSSCAGATAAQLALSQLADDPKLTEETRAWATIHLLF